MKFLMTLKWPLRLWQISGMVQFGVMKKSLIPVKNSKLYNYGMILLLMHFIALMLCMIFSSTYIDWSITIFTKYDNFVGMLAIRFVTCVIVAEAILKLDKQTEFLQQIIRVDTILHRKLRIELDYKKERFHSNILTIVWISTCLIFVITVLVIFLENTFATRLWLIYAPGLIIYSIHYHRMIFYKNIILRRYKYVNEYIEKMCLLEWKNTDMFDLILPFTQQTDAPNAQPITITQLYDVRNVYQMLYEATDMVNDMFWWSLPLCIAIDVHRLLVNCYYIFAVLLLNIARDLLVASFLWGGINIAHLILVARACHCIKSEVSLKCLYQVDE